ncbi:MAG: hypothetical protein BAJATHORv1_60019 [Candidatus Thorarchaeota archaeon]|nr:MAG: hypothetical protein BAJATHORv1_60019 [Candidatus Thorarchaeota archaeon]
MQIEFAGTFILVMAGLVLVLFIWLMRQNPYDSRKVTRIGQPGQPDPKGSGALSGSYPYDESYSPMYRASDKGGFPIGKKKDRKKTETHRRYSED